MDGDSGVCFVRQLRCAGALVPFARFACRVGPSPLTAVPRAAVSARVLQSCGAPLARCVCRVGSLLCCAVRAGGLALALAWSSTVRCVLLRVGPKSAQKFARAAGAGSFSDPPGPTPRPRRQMCAARCGVVSSVPGCHQGFSASSPFSRKSVTSLVHVMCSLLVGASGHATFRAHGKFLVSLCAVFQRGAYLL